MKKFLLSFVLLISLGFAASAAPAEIMTVTFGKAGNVSAPNNQVYTATQTYTGKTGTAVDNKTWTVVNFNNNNNGWSDMIKCGRKNTASTGSVATNFAFAENITNVTCAVTINEAQVSSVNLYVSADGTNWGTAVASEGSITKTTTSISLNVPTEKVAANSYYKVEFVCASAKSNGVVWLKSITYTGENSNPDDTRADAQLSYGKTEFSAVVGGEFTAPVLDNPNHIEGIVYTSSTPAVATVDATSGAVTIQGAGSTTIKADFAGNDTYKPGFATYTITVAEGASTLADFIAKGEANRNLELVMNCDLTITYTSGANVYVTDGATFGLIYKRNLGSFTPGQIVTKGWTGTVTVFNGLVEIVPNDATLTTSGTADVTYPEVGSVTTDDINRVVILKGVTFAEATTTSTTTNFEGEVGETTYTFRNTFGTASAEAGTYNVKCAVSTYDKNSATPSTDVATLQLLPIEYLSTEAPVEPEFVGDVVLAGMAITDDGIISGAISFTINNYNGETPEVTAVVLRADGTELTEQEGYAEVKLETPTIENGPARAAGTVAKYEGTMEGLILEPGEKGTNYKVKVNVKVGSAVAEATSLDTPTGVEGIVVDNEAPAVYYDLTGRTVENPASGLYIRVAGGKASKVYIR